jgi:hypothetical protein
MLVNTPSSVAAVTTGGLLTCALYVTGGMNCWGDNQFGEVRCLMTVSLMALAQQQELCVCLRRS